MGEVGHGASFFVPLGEIMSFFKRVAQERGWLRGSVAGVSPPRRALDLHYELQRQIWRRHEMSAPGSVTFVLISNAAGVPVGFVGALARGDFPLRPRALHHYEALAAHLEINLTHYL